MEMNQYLEIFLEESKEHLQSMNEKLLLLENDSKNFDLINEIFRSAHTLKGMAATMGYESMATLTHEMENLLDLVRNQKRIIDSDVMDTIFNSVDVLEQMVLSISNGGGDKVDISHLTSRLQAVISNDGKASKSITEKNNPDDETIFFDEYERTVIRQSLESGYSTYHIIVTLDAETILKSARAYMVYHELENYGEVFKTIPSVEELENEEFSNEFTVILLSKEDSNSIKNAIMKISEISKVNIRTISKENLVKNTSKVESKNSANSSSILSNEEDNEIKLTNQKQTKNHAGKMIRVDIERLDELMNLFSELIIDKGRLEQLSREIKNSQLTDTVEHMSRISSSLQNNILNLRMVPIEQVFNRFPRMIRDLAKELDKKVNLNIVGAETELDRTVIDEIGDPLVHLLRNAIDHGQETTQERIRKNKPEVGQINLKAYHSSNYIFIEVSDDGKGIDKDKILKKAIDKGFITQEAGKNLSEKQILDFIFASGFSTAEQVSDISGRGVGLDVVKTKIEALGGFIALESELEKGTKFTIQLPLTLSIISSMLVKIEDEKYAIPLSSIIETAIYKKKDIMLAHKQEVIDFRGRVVPLVDLKKFFQVPIISNLKDEDEVAVVIVRKGEKLAGLIVDSFIGQYEIVLKTLGNYLTNVYAISGATILGDGQVALIIDTNALIK